MVSEYAKLTPKMKKVLEIMSSARDEELSITELCRRAGVSTVSYYKYFNMPHFVNAYDKLTRDILKNAVYPIVKASIREGRKGSHQDRKMILEMTGDYQAKGSLDLNVKGFEDLLQGLRSDPVEEE